MLKKIHCGHLGLHAIFFYTATFQAWRELRVKTCDLVEHHIYARCYPTSSRICNSVRGKRVDQLLYLHHKSLVKCRELKLKEVNGFTARQENSGWACVCTYTSGNFCQSVGYRGILVL